MTTPQGGKKRMQRDEDCVGGKQEEQITNGAGTEMKSFSVCRQ